MTEQEILKSNIVQEIKTIKLPTYPDVIIDTPHMSCPHPDAIGTVRFTNDIKLEIRIYFNIINNTFRYVVSYNGDMEKMVLRHNVHDTVDMNIRSITRSIKALIDVSKKSEYQL